MRAHAWSTAEEGFTLIETILAFLVLALSLMILSQSISQATNQIHTADLSDAAGLVAERVLAMAQGQDEHAAGSGTDQASGLLWTWSNRVVRRSDQRSALPAAILVVVEVRKAPEAQPLLVLKSVRYSGAGL